MSGTKWEYVLDAFDWRVESGESIEREMVDRGRNGWELVSYVAINDGIGYTRWIHIAWRRRVEGES